MGVTGTKCAVIEETKATEQMNDGKTSRLHIICSPKRRRAGSGCAVATGDDPATPTALAIQKQRRREIEEGRPKLTERHTQLVISTWRILQHDLENLGTSIFTSLFESFPDLKNSFGPFKTLSPEDERFVPELRAHGTRVLRTVQDILDRRDDPDAAIDYLHQLGNKHNTYNVKINYIDIVTAQFMFSLEKALENHWTPEVEEAWAILFRFIMYIMKESMVL